MCLLIKSEHQRKIEIYASFAVRDMMFPSIANFNLIMQ